jgi:hypothetical protein
MPTVEDELDRRQMLYGLLIPVMNLCVINHLPTTICLLSFSHIWFVLFIHSPLLH